MFVSADRLNIIITRLLKYQAGELHIRSLNAPGAFCLYINWKKMKIIIVWINFFLHMCSVVYLYFSDAIYYYQVLFCWFEKQFKSVVSRPYQKTLVDIIFFLPFFPILLYRFILNGQPNFYKNCCPLISETQSSQYLVI